MSALTWHGGVYLLHVSKHKPVAELLKTKTEGIYSESSQLVIFLLLLPRISQK